MSTDEKKGATGTANNQITVDLTEFPGRNNPISPLANCERRHGADCVDAAAQL